MLDYYAPIQAGWRAIVERGVARGEVADDVDPDAVVSAIASPLLVLTLLERRTPNARERRALEHLVLRATRPESPVTDETRGPARRRRR